MRPSRTLRGLQTNNAKTIEWANNSKYYKQQRQPHKAIRTKCKKITFRYQRTPALSIKLNSKRTSGLFTSKYYTLLIRLCVSFLLTDDAVIYSFYLSPFDLSMRWHSLSPRFFINPNEFMSFDDFAIVDLPFDLCVCVSANPLSPHSHRTVIYIYYCVLQLTFFDNKMTESWIICT